MWRSALPSAGCRLKLYPLAFSPQEMLSASSHLGDSLDAMIIGFLGSLGQGCSWEAENQALAKPLLDVGLQIKAHPVFTTIARK